MPSDLLQGDLVSGESCPGDIASDIDRGSDFRLFELVQPASTTDHEVASIGGNETGLRAELKAAESRSRELKRVADAALAALEYKTFHDTLTGLPNRASLERLLNEIAVEGATDDLQAACLNIDLDHFKQVNDTHGRGAGDAVLASVGAALMILAKDARFVGRVGGDEFIVVLTGRNIERRSLALARKIAEKLGRPFQFGGHRLHVGATVGVSVCALSTASQNFVSDAVQALQVAREEGFGKIKLMTPNLRTMIEERRSLADEIANAFDNDEFVPFFQPQVLSENYEIVGVEALARWRHPRRGLLTPEAFLQTVQKLGRSSELDTIIMCKALRHFNAWRQAGHDLKRISVNVSEQQLLSDSFLATIAALPLVPGSLTFELLESISFDDRNETFHQRIKAVKQLGIEIEIDDFGTGHASITSLLDMTPTRLKIDRKLIRPLSASGPGYRLVAAIVDIAKTLRIGIVAEGVETAEQAFILESLGCETLQGYAFSKPISANAFEALLDRSSRIEIIQSKG